MEDPSSGNKLLEGALSIPPTVKRTSKHSTVSNPRKSLMANGESSTHEDRWYDMYVRLVKFKHRYGHCLVPNRYRHDLKLGSWVAAQRRQYKIIASGKKISVALTADRIDKLQDLGFQWSAENPRGSRHTSRMLSAFFSQRRAPAGGGSQNSAGTVIGGTLSNLSLLLGEEDTTEKNIIPSTSSIALGDIQQGSTSSFGSLDTLTRRQAISIPNPILDSSLAAEASRLAEASSLVAGASGSPKLSLADLLALNESKKSSALLQTDLMLSLQTCRQQQQQEEMALLESLASAHRARQTNLLLSALLSTSNGPSTNLPRASLL